MSEESAGDESVDTNRIPWMNKPVPELNHKLPVKMLIDDPDTGMSVLKVKYDMGFTTTWHTHNCAHGMYVLDGILNTNKGQFGPGEFVWFSEGERMFHGATEENDCIYLFIINKPFDIQFEHIESAGSDENSQ